MSVVTLRTVVVGLAIGIATCVMLPACGSDAPAADAPDGSGYDDDPGGGLPACQTPRQGCPCSEEGAQAECGHVKEIHGDQVFCAMGNIVCQGGQWGACSTSNVVAKSLSSLRAQASVGVSAPAACGAVNPCDPNCQLLEDNPSIAAVPSGLVKPTGGGITVAGAGAAVACKVPADASVVYGALPVANRPNGGPPATCSTTPKDNCGLGRRCAGGNCIANAVGDSGACTGADFTIEAPCYDGTRLNMQVCNRGTVAASAGILRIAHFTGTSNAAFTCPAAPALPPMSSVGAAGDCTIDLSAEPLAPGACTSFIPTVDCVANVANDSGDHFYYVNRSNTGGAVLSECNACNNFSATTGSLSTLPSAACNAVSCGGGGGTSCTALSTATVTGQVLDPQSKRPIYGATVYVPNTAVGVSAGALDGPNVTCDRCTTTFKGMPAKASATTNVEGRFTLENVPGGATFPMVIQLGRFRRQLTMPAITACGTLNLNTAAGRQKTHLPGTKAMAGDTAACGGGVTPPCDAVAPDLPKIGIVTGHGDALECLLLKMGISSSEFTAPTGTGNVHMYMYKNASLLQGAANSGSGNNISAGGVGLTFTGGAAGNCYTSACDQQRINSMGTAATLLSSSANVNQYNMLVLPCADGNTFPTTAMQANVRSWLDAGGRLFASHHSVEDFIRNPNGNPNDDVANWTSTAFQTANSSPATGWATSSADQNDRSGATPATSSCKSNGTTPCSTTAQSNACSAAGGGACTTSSWLVASIDQSFPSGAALASWLQATWPTTPYGGPGNPTPPAGKVFLPDYRHDVTSITAASTGWFGGSSTYTGTGSGPQVSMVSFDTPVGASSANQCGRAVLPFMHVTPKLADFGTSSGTVPTFPAACGAADAALTGQELAFEFMMWESMRCLAPLTSTPYAPQPPVIVTPPLVGAEMYRDFDATCTQNARVAWSFLEWQSLVPSLTNITFRAYTSNDLATDPFPAVSSTSMPIIGIADRSATGSTWDRDHQTNPGKTVDEHLGKSSKSKVRVYMKFNPTTTAAPTLYDWRLMYSCIPYE